MKNPSTKAYLLYKVVLIAFLLTWLAIGLSRL